MDLQSLCKRIADRLGIVPLDIRFEEMNDDSRLYIKEEYVAINKKFKNDYIECAKVIAHEYRHVFQLFYINMFSDERAKRWKNEMINAVNTSNIDECGLNYISQEIELDAFAFTKFYLEQFDDIKVTHLSNQYEKFINKYTEINGDVL